MHNYTLIFVLFFVFSYVAQEYIAVVLNLLTMLFNFYVVRFYINNNDLHMVHHKVRYAYAFNVFNVVSVHDLIISCDFFLTDFRKIV